MRRLLSRYSPTVWAVCVNRTIATAGYSMTLPFLGIYFIEELGLSAGAVGAYFAAIFLIGCVGLAVGGDLCDRLGRKPAMLIAVWGRGAGIAAIAVCAYLEAGFWAYVPCHVVMSFLGNFIRPATQAITADLHEGARRAEALGFLRMGTNLGWGAGPIAGGLVVASSYPLLFGATAGLLAVAGVIVLVFVREPAVQRARRPRYLDGLTLFGDADYRRLAAASFLVSIVMGQLIVTLPLYASEVVGATKPQTGWLFVINGGLVFVFQVGVSIVCGRFRFAPVLVFGSLLYAVAYGGAGLVVGIGWLYVVVAVSTFAEMIVSPTQVALAASLVPEQRRGLGLGLFGMVMMLGEAIGPLLGGLALEVYPGCPWAAWAVVGAVGVPAALLYASLIGRARDQSVSFDSSAPISSSAVAASSTVSADAADVVATSTSPGGAAERETA